MKGMEFTEMDIEKLIVIQSVIDGKRTGKEASNKLNLSERQIWRLVKKVKNSGVEGIKHGNRFIHQPRFITFEFKEHIKNLKLSDDYCDANFKHFQELIEEHENIKIGLYASGDRWVKNFYNQLAGASLIENAKIGAGRSAKKRTFI